MPDLTRRRRRSNVRDAQSIIGKKVEIYSPPYSAINMWSSENAGKIDFNAEMELWTRAGHIRVTLGKGVDIRKLDHLLACGVERMTAAAVPRAAVPFGRQ